MSKDSNSITIISIIIVVAVILGIGLFIKNSVTDSKDDSKSSSNSNIESEAVGSVKDKPIILSSSDISMSAEEFADKYTGKFIQFDGLVQGTASVKSANKPHTGLIFGDDVNRGSFSDGSLFWITSGNTTFSDDLSEFASDNNTPYESSNYPKVRVLAKVSQYDESNSAVQLEPIMNVDGKSPSVKSR